jgi:hypothetical protein
MEFLCAKPVSSILLAVTLSRLSRLPAIVASDAIMTDTEKTLDCDRLPFARPESRFLCHEI